jgi:hypothetical protein
VIPRRGRNIPIKGLKFVGYFDETDFSGMQVAAQFSHFIYCDLDGNRKRLVELTGNGDTVGR